MTPIDKLEALNELIAKHSGTSIAKRAALNAVSKAISEIIAELQRDEYVEAVEFTAAQLEAIGMIPNGATVVSEPMIPRAEVEALKLLLRGASRIVEYQGTIKGMTSEHEILSAFNELLDRYPATTPSPGEGEEGKV